MGVVKEGARPGLDRNVLIVFPGLMLAMMLAALDGTIVVTALPTIVTDLGGLSSLSWVVAAYLLGSCVSTPIHGKIGDLFGRKRLFQGAIILFLVGSALSGAAQSMTQLIICRAIQGIGAGGLLVNSQAILGDLVSPAERGRYQGFMQATFALATIGGPLLGGVITELMGWRWIFYVNLPIGVVALIVIGVVLKLPPMRRAGQRVDWLGAALLTGGASAFIVVTSSGGSVLPWLSPQIVGLSIAAVLLLALFVAVERRAADPLLNLALFRRRGFAVGVPLTFVIGFAMLGVTTFGPLYQQVVIGVAPTAAGLRLSPLMLVMLATSALTGRAISRNGRYRRFPIIGTTLGLVAMVLWALFDVDTPYWFQLIAFVLTGISFGLVNAVLLLSAQNSVGPEDVGVATSTNTFARSIGSSVGIAAFGAVFAATLTSALRNSLPASIGAGSPSNMSREHINGLPPAVRDAVVQSFADALHVVFLVSIAVIAVGLLLALWLPEYPLRRSSATFEAAEPADRSVTCDARRWPR